ncbi:hypothetical protein TEA_010266 [Camellia sinensis var. sinensis]|uniref:CG-1 domain-containing protein n=1 Tax=Camellia sinensis var. sinensis TaxID=542762 RepID=A0A4S4DGM0_CAMSN|nr:hypothetical protein TEA_010266 [Camellia sinensis var. sinensis]
MGVEHWSVQSILVYCLLHHLDVGSIMEDAKTRWLRPNEIHAILCNPKYFSVNVKPVNLPKSNYCGTIVLFDRKMLRNFRKDGYNWKKKKDGKTVKEAHEHLKSEIAASLKHSSTQNMASSSRGLLTLFPDLNESTRERTGAVALEPQPSALSLLR